MAVASTAYADDRETAKSLLAQGQKEMAADNWVEACPAIAESHRLDPLPATLFSLAECETKWGKVGSALRHYEEYLSRVARLPEEAQAEEAERVDQAREQRSMLQTVAPTLKIELPPDAPPDTKVERNGEPVLPGQLGTPIPVDPGPQRIVATAPGQEPREYMEELSKGDSAVVRISFGASSASTDSPIDPEAAGEEPGDSTTADAADADSGDVQRGIAYGAWGVGAAGALVAIIGGSVAWANRSTIKDNCDGEICTTDGKDAADTAQSAATASNVGLVIAGVGAIAGTILYLTAPRADEDATGALQGVRFAAGPEGGAIGWEVRW
ncbi:MAG: hypothetical protein JRI55_06915 [Deltaproteobacteria bacterium]|jgi:hypothetical protein|nr:hypothetical protein [Deltaproteobacteria bacterium]